MYPVSFPCGSLHDNDFNCLMLAKLSCMELCQLEGRSATVGKHNTRDKTLTSCCMDNGPFILVYVADCLFSLKVHTALKLRRMELIE